MRHGKRETLCLCVYSCVILSFFFIFSHLFPFSFNRHSSGICCPLSSVHLLHLFLSHFYFPTRLFCIQPSELRSCACVHVLCEHSMLTEWSVIRSLASVTPHSTHQMKCTLSLLLFSRFSRLLSFVREKSACTLLVLHLYSTWSIVRFK